MAAHPAGKVATSKHQVEPGDSLWSIADKTLPTKDPVAVARYASRLFRINQAIIGSDPNLILPGQVLELPERR